jgi:hypothetical protein
MTAKPEQARRNLPALHAFLSPRKELIARRRALYRLAVELLASDAITENLRPDLIDSPLMRYRVGQAIASGKSLRPSDLVAISDVADAAYRVGTGPISLHLVSRPAADSVLSEFLNKVELELNFQTSANNKTHSRFLTRASGAKFSSAREFLSEGVAQATAMSPQLIGDLLPHIELVGFLDSGPNDGLVSASLRDFPGIIIGRSPSSAIEVAELIVHEGAHQKLFELAITHEIFTVESGQCPPFQPPWHSKGRTWPLEQTLAAGHAYACIAQFAEDAGPRMHNQVLAKNSALPHAAQRRDIIVDWLLNYANYCGHDAHLLLEGICGRKPSARINPPVEEDIAARKYRIVEPLKITRNTTWNRTLVGRPSNPPEFYWLDLSTFQVLTALRRSTTYGKVAAAPGQQEEIETSARHELAAALSRLVALSLITVE